MGNYMETCIQREEEIPQQQQQQQQQQQKQEEEEQKQGQQEKQESCDSCSKESSRLRVKLVLTKDELQWLLVQLKKDEGRKLEEVLGEIEKSRLRGESVAKWRPCLESIMESPDVHHQIMDR